MSDTITAREFLLNTFNTDFLSDEEKETIITAMELFTKGKCKQQREICHEAYMSTFTSKLDEEDAILNAKEPEF
jgi:hypothetical protein